MMSFFLNPWIMVAGAALVLTPIIIHLINRMRFRRIKWAAMEFLLKAQKKMRRKKILEQLLLLFLRCLLVFLAGLLFARFLGFSPEDGKETRPVVHVVILDDTPSMADTGEGGVGNDAFSRAKSFITDKLMPAAMKAETPQKLRIIRLSDETDILSVSDAQKEKTREPEPINNDLIDKVKGLLAPLKPVTVRAGLAPALKKAKEYLDRTGDDTAKVVYVVSDLRAVDWDRDAGVIEQAVKELNDVKVKVHLVDSAAPNRKADIKTLPFSDNVAIVEFKPRNRIVAKGREAEFEVRLKNYGNAAVGSVLVKFFINGLGDVITSVGFENLQSGEERTRVIQVTLEEPSATVATKENPLGRFNVVTAVISNAAGDAIATDNVRHAVVELREKLSVLVISNPDDKGDKTGDSYYLRNLFETKYASVEWVNGKVEDLAKLDLREFSSIYLLNVPQLTSDIQVKNLERYIREGGGVGVFLGPAVKPEAYAKMLYKNGEGFFPFPMEDKPTEPLSDAAKTLRSYTLAKRLLLRDSAAKTHPALLNIYQDAIGSASKDTAEKVERSFLFVGIDQHWKIPRIGKWREDRAIRELYCLPNESPSSDYEAPAKRLYDEIRLKYTEPKFEKYRDMVNGLLDKIRAATAAGDDARPLTELARYLDRLLADQVSEGDAAEAQLREFWGNPELATAKSMAQSLRDSAKYGDPLYVARPYGGGRVAIFTIPIAAPWTDWPYGPGTSGWVAIMTELQKYLSGGGSDDNRVLGSAMEGTFETARYKPTVASSFLTYDPGTSKAAQTITPTRDPIPGQEAKTFALDAKDGADRLNFKDTTRAGLYTFALTWQKRASDPENAPATKIEYLAAVFNFDTDREGDLRRAGTADFKTVAKGAEDVHSPEDNSWLEKLEQKPTDLSSGRWIFLLLLLILIFEQAMAVRLSYHRRADDLQAFAPSAAAALAGRTALPTDTDTAPPGGSAS